MRSLKKKKSYKIFLLSKMRSYLLQDPQRACLQKSGSSISTLNSKPFLLIIRLWKHNQGIYYFHMHVQEGFNSLVVNIPKTWEEFRDLMLEMISNWILEILSFYIPNTQVVIYLGCVMVRSKSESLNFHISRFDLSN